MEALARVCESCGGEFAKFYDGLVPGLKRVVAGCAFPAAALQVGG
jgi:hypothetical protein